MKILKIFGIVVGIHVFALILIFANPGCSSTSKTPPATADMATKSDAAPVVTTPASPSNYSAPASSGSSAITFNPNAPAAAAAPTADGTRAAPTRPGSPVAGVLMAEPVADVTPAASYTVKSGDNLSNIAKKHNITVAQLTAANNLSNKATLHPGQKLVIPSKTGAPTAAATLAPTSAMSKNAEAAPATSGPRPEGVKHVVKSGESLSTIAKKYDVRSGEIAAANNISDPAKIRPGMELIIPGWHAPGSKTGKTQKAAPTSTAKSTPPASTPAQPAPETQPAATTPPPVPVIRVDEGTAAPAPKL